MADAPERARIRRAAVWTAVAFAAAGCARAAREMPPPPAAPAPERIELGPPIEGTLCPATDAERTLAPMLESWWEGRATYEATRAELAKALAALEDFDAEELADSPCMAIEMGPGRAVALDLLADAAARVHEAAPSAAASRTGAIFVHAAAAERYVGRPARLPAEVLARLDAHVAAYPDDADGRALFGVYHAEAIDATKPWFAAREDWERTRTERAWALLEDVRMTSPLAPELKARALYAKALLANERADHQAWVDAWADMKDAFEAIDAFDARIWNEGNGRIGEYWLRQGRPEVAVHMMCLITEQWRDAGAPYAVGLAAGLLETGDEPCARAYVRATVDRETWEEAELFALLATALYEGDGPTAARAWNRFLALEGEARATGEPLWYFERARSLRERITAPPETTDAPEAAAPAVPRP